MTIHPTAVIHPGTKLGKNVSIEPYAVINEGVTLGDDCIIGSHAVIEFTEMGNGCKVFPFVSLGHAPQHLKYNGEPTKLKIGQRCVFRENVTVHRGTALDQNLTLIGDDGYFMALSHIAHDCVIGNKVIMANGAQLAGHVQVADNCFISTTVGIHQHVRIGQGALVSGGAMVPLDVPPFCLAQGDRADIRGINIIGMRRSGYKSEDLRLIKLAYKTLYLSDLTLKEALAHRNLNVDNKAVEIFKSFFKDPKRGFLRPDKLKLSKEPITA